ncbi:efflux RND transporter periplasmic adaptor subunit, partial [Burkholderia cepacia]
QFSDVTVDQTTGSVTIRAVFPNPGKVLLPGMFVRARIEEGVNENAFLVPQIGVTHDQKGQAIAMVVNASNKVEPRPLKTTGMQGPNWVVEGGLQAGDHVIVQGADKVRPGATVKTVPAQLAPAADAASGAAAASAAPAAAGSGAAAASGAAASGAAPASAAAASSAQ